MTDILGYDCDGRPLRKGDKVVVIRSSNFPECEGLVSTVVCRHPLNDNAVITNIRAPRGPHLGKRVAAYPISIRKVKGESDQPCNQSFEELVQGLKNGMPATPVPARKVGL